MFFKKQRKPNRLGNYDYSASGIYFITICTAARVGDAYMPHLLGNIVNGKMILNPNGAIAEKCWREIPLHFPAATLDVYVLMPDHIHGIISIDNNLETPAPSPHHSIQLSTHKNVDSEDCPTIQSVGHARDSRKPSREFLRLTAIVLRSYCSQRSGTGKNPILHSKQSPSMAKEIGDA